MTAFAILRHAVPMRSDGLSDLQHAMLHDPHPVRIFSAPTGAGKSFAFQRAVTDHGSKVLFIVPTRRLAGNLAAGLAAELSHTHHPAAIARMVKIWTSDARARILEQDPDAKVGSMRVADLREEDLKPGEGRMIIATPESVAYALLRPAKAEHGHAVLNIADLLRVDHVVFDEFHTIDPRGLGIAAAVAAITSRMENGARLTFLSATPIDVRTSLIDFGIEASAITTARETVVTGTADETAGMRALHGDVAVEIVNDEAIPALLTRLEPDIRRCLDGDGGAPRQLVVIYDRLTDLHRDKAALVELFERLGVTENERLAINSTDDSVADDLGAGFTVGSAHDPTAFKVLVATSSVELGVTFRAGLIVMEPGYGAAATVQRIGRVARGDEMGQVVMTVSRAQRDRDPELRALLDQFAALPPRVDVSTFLAACLRSVAQRFDVSPGDLSGEERVYTTMPSRAAWCAALLWVALGKTWAASPGIRDTLRAFRPPKAGRIGALLARVERDGGTYQLWAQQMTASATVLRDIMPSVDLEDPNGKRRTLRWSAYASTAALKSLPTRYDMENDRLVVLLDVSVDAPGGPLSNLGGSPYVIEIETLWPHSREAATLPKNRAIKTFVNAAEEAMSTRSARRHREAMEAAITLVRLTRVLPAPPRESAAIIAPAGGSEIL